MTETNYARAVDFESREVYYPEHRPGYTAWVALFPFGNGDIGLAFDEVRRAPNPRFIPVSIEFVESCGFAYQFDQVYVSSGHPNLLHERVHMKSPDAGRTWKEFHRGWGKAGYRVAYPDGRLVAVFYGSNQYYERGPDRRYTSVEESFDGGRSSRQIARLSPAIIPHRVKKLRDGSLVILGPIEPPFGPGCSRPKANARYPGERFVQPALMFSPDGGYPMSVEAR